MAKKRKCWIYVDRNIIASNKKNGTKKPPISLRTSKKIYKCNEIEFGDWVIGYYPEKPLPCGATVYIIGPLNEVIDTVPRHTE